MIRFLAIALALLPLTARAQFIGPNGGVDSMPFASPPAFQFAAPSPGAYSTLTAATGQTISCSRASTATYADASGVWHTATSNQCAVDARGLQAEGASTNVVLQSGDLSNAAWTTNQTLTVTANSCADPFGNTTMAKLDASASATFANGRYQSLSSVTGSGAWTFSGVMRPVDATDDAAVDVFVGTSATVGTCTCTCAYFDGSACSCTTSGVGTTDCNTNFASLSKPVVVALTIAPSTTWGTNPNIGFYAGNLTSTHTKICAGEAQVENQPFRTSYIATAGTSATRAADSITFTKPSGVTLNAGTWSASSTAQLEGIGPTASWGVPIGSNVNYLPVIRTNRNAVTGQTNVNMDCLTPTASGASVVTVSDAQKLTSTKYSISQVAGTSFGCSANGSSVSAAYPTQVGTEPTTIYLGGHNGTSNNLFGWISAACLDSSPTKCAP